VLAEAAGNPLGVVELAGVAARHGAGALLPAWLPLTTRLERTFGALVGELPAATRSLLLVAGLDDGDGMAERLAAGSIVIGRAATDDDLAPALDARLLEIDAAYRVRFRHPLVRSAVYQSASVGQRRAAHAALAEVVTEPDRRVWHLAAAAMRPDAALADALDQAGRRAARRGSLASAIAAYERAAQLSPDPLRRADRLMSAAVNAAELGDMPTFARLAQVINSADLDEPGRQRLALMREVFMEGGWSGAARLAAFAAAADRLRQAGDAERALDTLTSIALRAYWSNPDPETRHLMLATARRFDADPGDPRLLSLLAHVGPIEYGADVVERLAAALPGTAYGPEQQFLLGSAASALGALEASALLLAGAVAGLRALGRLGTLAQALTNQAWTAAALGDVRLAAAAAAEGRGLAAETGQLSWALTADIIGGHVAALRGDGETARAMADVGESVLLPIGAHPMLALVQTIRGVAAVSGGRPAEAYEQLRRIFDPNDLTHHPYTRFSVLGHLAEAAVASGHDADLRDLVDELTPLAAASGSPALAAGLAYAAALLAPDDRAEETFRAAIDGAAVPFDRARLQLAYGGWLRRQRRPADARPVLRAAAGTFDALGAKPWADRARQELRASGEKLRRAEDARDRLTPQEWQIFPKLGVTSRADLATVMAGYVI
jgi:tetratricopeptide (TPR) repeat protein